MTFVGGRDIDVALAESLARTQTRAGLPVQAQAVLRGRRRQSSVQASFILYSSDKRLKSAELNAQGSSTSKKLKGNITSSRAELKLYFYSNGTLSSSGGVQE